MAPFLRIKSFNINEGLAQFIVAAAVGYANYSAMVGNGRMCYILLLIGYLTVLGLPAGAVD